MKGRDFFIGALLGAFLVILLTSHNKGNTPQASARVSTQSTRHPASAKPTRRSASVRPGRHSASARPATGGSSQGTSSGDWLIAIASVIAIVSSVVAVTITVRAGPRTEDMTGASG